MQAARGRGPKREGEGRREKAGPFAACVVFMFASNEADESRVRQVERKSTCACRRSRSYVMACEHHPRHARPSVSRKCARLW